MDFYDYYIVFGSVVWQRPTFYGCFVWLCLFEPICQEVARVCDRCQLAVRWSQDPYFAMVSLLIVLVDFLSVFFTESLFNYVLIVHIASYGFDTTHAVL